MFSHLHTPYTDTAFGVRAELRSPHVVPSYRQRAILPYSQIGTLHKAPIFYISPCADTTFGVRAGLRSPQVVPSYRRCWSIFGSFWFCIFGSGMWPSSLRVKFRLFTFWNIADTPRTRGSECKQSYGYDTQKTMFAAATVVPCRLKWEGWLCVMLCVYYSVRRIFFQRLLAERTNLSETSRSDIFPVFLCSLFFLAELLDVWVCFL